MKIAVACDRGVLEYKEIVKEMLTETGYKAEDFGCHGCESVDYPDHTGSVTQSVADGKNDKGIVICGIGIGVSTAASKVRGTRCALCSDPVSAKPTREHNNSNVLVTGQRIIGMELMKEIVRVWVNTEFPHDECHQRRIDKVTALEKQHEENCKNAAVPGRSVCTRIPLEAVSGCLSLL